MFQPLFVFNTANTRVDDARVSHEKLIVRVVVKPWTEWTRVRARGNVFKKYERY